MLKSFLVNLISSGTKISSKRLTAIFLVLNLIALTYVATFTIYRCPQEMFDSLAILGGTLFGATAVEAIFNKTKNNGTSKDTNTTTGRGSSEAISTNTNANTREEIIG